MPEPVLAERKTPFHLSRTSQSRHEQKKDLHQAASICLGITVEQSYFLQIIQKHSHPHGTHPRQYADNNKDNRYISR